MGLTHTGPSLKRLVMQCAGISAEPQFSVLVEANQKNVYCSKMASSDDIQGGFHTMDDGPFAGWRTWVGSLFETLSGPFYSRIADDGTVTCAFAPQEKNANYVGILHGGALMTFADHAASTLAYLANIGPSVTVAFNCEFLGAGVAGSTILATGRVLRETKSMVFVQGLLEQNGQPILGFSSAAKKITPR